MHCPLPSQIWNVSMSPLQVMPHDVFEGPAQLPVVSQSVAAHGPLLLQFDEQQWPAPLTPQMPLEHCAFAVHGAPGTLPVPELLVAVLVTELPALELLDELDELDELEFELEEALRPPKPPRPPRPPKPGSTPPKPPAPCVPPSAL
jgi:hypothetical protein